MNSFMIYEQNLAIDDNLLPSAAELEKLKEVDPNIIDWILKRTEVEQDARLKFNAERVNLTKYDLKRGHTFNLTALVFGFVILLIVLALSAFFLFQGKYIEGTLFGGAVIVTAAIYFIKAATSTKKK